MRCRECRKEFQRRIGRAKIKRSPRDMGTARRFALEHPRWMAGIKSCLGYLLGSAIFLGILILIARALISWDSILGTVIFVFMLAVIVALLAEK